MYFLYMNIKKTVRKYCILTFKMKSYEKRKGKIFWHSQTKKFQLQLQSSNFLAAKSLVYKKFSYKKFKYKKLATKSIAAKSFYVQLQTKQVWNKVQLEKVEFATASKRLASQQLQKSLATYKTFCHREGLATKVQLELAKEFSFKKVQLATKSLYCTSY